MGKVSGPIEPCRSLDGLRLSVLRQKWDQPEVKDVRAATKRELRSSGALERIRPGDQIAITAGSRGIACMPTVLRAIIAAVREAGGVPFIFPAMGSHGGGTAEGQRALLAELGITEDSMGVPIRASMEVVPLGETPDGLPVVMDAEASRAAGIIVVNRIKKHTNFDAPLESGLCKMCVIGMGKHAQALVAHLPNNAGLRDNVAKFARVVLQRARILAGVAIVENAWGGVAELVGLRPDEFIQREPALLERAKQYEAKLPFQELDITVVERMGKEISGTGMDCYVVGRRKIPGEPEWPEAPRIRSLAVLDLTEASHGNAVGVGLAEFATRRLADKIDWRVTRTNIMTSGNIDRGKLPFVYDTDREVFEAAAYRERATPIDKLRLLGIRDTLHLRHVVVSSTLAVEARSRDDLEIVEDDLPLRFDPQGRWLSPLPEEC